MKKSLFALIIVLILGVAAATPAFAESASPLLYDGAELLSDAEEARIEEKLSDVREEYKVELVIVTVDDIGLTTPERYAENYFDSGNYGFGDGRDGVLLLVSMADRDYYILANGEELGAAAISTDDVEYIGESVAEYLSDGDYAGGLEEFVAQCEYQIDGEINGFPFDFLPNIVIALIIGFVVAFIVTGIWKGQLKSVRQKGDASGYTKRGSMKINVSRDFFLYKTVTRHKIQKASTSSSGSVSRHGGGGKF